MMAILGVGVEFIVFCLSYIPRMLLDASTEILQILLLPWSAKEYKIARRNINRVFGLPPHTHFSDLFLKQWTRHTIICILETIRGIIRPGQLQVDGFTKLESLVKAVETSERGVIFVTSHLGSWELCAYFAGRSCQRPLHVLAKPPRYAWARTPLERLRRRMQVEILWTDDKSLLRNMLSVLKRGESLGFVMDQKPERRVGPIVDFFGHPTAFVGGPATLTVKHKFPVIGIHVVRTGECRYNIHSETLLTAEHSCQDEQQASQIFATFIEKSIRTFPEQWTWNYRRWKEGSAQS